MARDRGVYNMSGNIELSKEAPLDARRKVNTFAELFLEATWKDSNNKVWLYDGMTVEVGDRLGELWQLKSKTSYSRQEDWIKISGGIEEAPKDGNPYMRKNGAWNAYTQIEEVYTFVADINGNKISQDAYNGLKDAVKAGKVIAIKLADIDGRWIVSLSSLSGDTINLIVYFGDAFQTIVIKSDLSVTETNKNFILRDNTAQYEVTGDYNPAHKKYVDTVTNNIKNNVLLKNNTTAFSPTNDYNPATKKYVDDNISSARSVGYMMQLTEIDASGLDENTWYPVTIAAGIRMCMRAEVLVALDSGTKPSWSTHDRGFSTRKIWEWAPSAWGINAVSDIKVYLSDFIHAQLDPVRGLDFLSHYNICYVFVRGGGKYHFYVSHEAKVILHTDTYTLGDQSVSPTIETPAEIVADIVKKEYVDNIGYGKVINVADGSLLTINKNIWGIEAYDYIVKMFGSTDVIKNTVIDICDNHTKYYIHSYSSPKNCIELSSVYAYYTYEERYEIQFNISYYTTQGAVSKRIAIVLNLFDDDKSDDIFFIEDILVSDNLQRVVKRTKSEYDDISTKQNETAYLVTDD
jgi:hypothetical protein|nr:MAG TPA: envelope glycoprotein [Crassvirales sp.]